MQRVAVVDYGMGNLRSVAKALEHVADGDFDVLVTSDPETIAEADRMVFPGQGAIGDFMAALERLQLVETVQVALKNKPSLGICVGQQALVDHSEEDGGTDALGIYAGRVCRFPGDARDPKTGERLKIPHMGWNHVHFDRDHPLWAGIGDGDRFYFVHSYYVQTDDPGLTTGRTEYAVPFASAIGHENVFAVQFHPEKSQRPGLRLLQNFLGWDGVA